MKKITRWPWSQPRGRLLSLVATALRRHRTQERDREAPALRGRHLGWLGSQSVLRVHRAHTVLFGGVPASAGHRRRARLLPHLPPARRAQAAVARPTLRSRAGPQTQPRNPHALLPAPTSQLPTTVAKGRNLARGNTYLSGDSLGRGPDVLRRGARAARRGWGTPAGKQVPVSQPLWATLCEIPPAPNPRQAQPDLPAHALQFTLTAGRRRGAC